MMDEKGTFLLVIDLQGNLVLRMHEHEQLLTNIQRLVKMAAILDLPLVWSEQAPDKIGATVGPVAGLLSERAKPIAKRSFSCYACPPLRARIDGLRRRHVLICGIEAHVCIYQTARDLLAHGYQVDIIADAVSSRSLVNTKIALKRLRGLGAGIASVELAACDLIKTADHPKFRDIMGHIK